MTSAPPVDGLEQAAFALLAATEALWTALAESPSSADWEALYEHRCAMFAALERAVSGRAETLSPLAVSVRTCVERIAELDGAILRTGAQALEQLQRERIALGSRRRAVLAHGLQERDTPRAVTVKA